MQFLAYFARRWSDLTVDCLMQFHLHGISFGGLKTAV